MTDWDGERVHFECRENLVDVGARLRHAGWISPFGGTAKLPWNLEWAAQWSLFGVTIEPCGKDLSTAGGSRDRSDAIAREVFEREPPLNVPYEFLNIGGKKMSTSKGRGAAAHAIAEVIPPEQLRFLFLRPRPNQAIEFDPDGTDAIPRLFDEFDRFAAATAGREVKGELSPGYEATFRYSLLDPDADVAAEAAAFRPGVLAPRAAPPDPGRRRRRSRVEAEKGSALNERERVDPRRAGRRGAGLARRLRAGVGPDRGSTRRRAAEAAAALDARPAAVPGRSSRTSRDRTRPASGDAWQALIFDVAKHDDLPPRRAFEAIYLAFLGRPNGPRAGWLLASLDRDFVYERLRAASGWTEAGPPASRRRSSERRPPASPRRPRRHPPTAPPTRARTRRSSIRRWRSMPSGGGCSPRRRP